MDMQTVKITGSNRDGNVNVHIVYENFDTYIRDIFDKHIPIKER